jgi:hypothetical protein
MLPTHSGVLKSGRRSPCKGVGAAVLEDAPTAAEPAGDGAATEAAGEGAAAEAAGEGAATSAASEAAGELAAIPSTGDVIFANLRFGCAGVADFESPAWLDASSVVVIDLWEEEELCRSAKKRWVALC